MKRADFVGSWKLVSYELRASDGRAEQPFGGAPAGRLMYDAHGRMAGQCMDPRRPKFACSNAARGSHKEVRAAFTRYIAYYGSYTLDARAGTVTHHVEGCLYPNWVGTDLVRKAEFSGKRMTLRTPPIQTGSREVVGTLVWEREG